MTSEMLVKWMDRPRAAYRHAPQRLHAYQRAAGEYNPHAPNTLPYVPPRGMRPLPSAHPWAPRSPVPPVLHWHALPLCAGVMAWNVQMVDKLAALDVGDTSWGLFCLEHRIQCDAPS